RLTLGFEINASRETIEFVVAGFGRTELTDHRSKISGGLYHALVILLRLCARLGIRSLRSGQSWLALRVEQLRHGHLWKARARGGKQGLPRRSGICRSNNRRC